MTPAFANAVDPVFLFVLGLLDRIQSNTARSGTEERQAIEHVIAECDAQLGNQAGWELAKYGLVAWIDDLLISTSWTGRDWWEGNALEFAYFKTRDRATNFFVKAKEAADMPRRDALEVFYLCVVLGFRGLYTLSDAEFIAGQLELPPTIEGWTRSTSKLIQLRQGRPPIREMPRPASGAPPLEGKYLLVGTTFIGVILAAILAVMIGIGWLRPFDTAREQPPGTSSALSLSQESTQ